MWWKWWEFHCIKKSEFFSLSSCKQARACITSNKFFVGWLGKHDYLIQTSVILYDVLSCFSDVTCVYHMGIQVKLPSVRILYSEYYIDVRTLNESHIVRIVSFSSSPISPLLLISSMEECILFLPDTGDDGFHWKVVLSFCSVSSPTKCIWAII